jgi:hypothetical protein
MILKIKTKTRASLIPNLNNEKNKNMTCVRKIK